MEKNIPLYSSRSPWTGYYRHRHHPSYRSTNRPHHDQSSYYQIKNKPVLALQDFPDPGLIHFNGTWFAYGTDARVNNTRVPHVPVATSRDFVNWTLVQGYATLPILAHWEAGVNHWAPDVIQRVCTMHCLVFFFFFFF